MKKSPQFPVQLPFTRLCFFVCFILTLLAVTDGSMSPRIYNERRRKKNSRTTKQWKHGLNMIRLKRRCHYDSGWLKIIAVLHVLLSYTFQLMSLFFPSRLVLFHGWRQTVLCTQHFRPERGRTVRHIRTYPANVATGYKQKRMKMRRGKFLNHFLFIMSGGVVLKGQTSGLSTQICEF